MLEQVKSFKTSDGRLFDNKVQALSNEFQLELRGKIQEKIRGTGNMISIQDAAAIISLEAEPIAAIISKYKTAIGRAKASAKKVEKIV